MKFKGQIFSSECAGGFEGKVMVSDNEIPAFLNHSAFFAPGTISVNKGVNCDDTNFQTKYITGVLHKTNKQS